MKPEKLAAGRYRYRGRYLIRTTWGPGPRGGEKPRWEVGDDDAHGGVTLNGTFTHRTMKEAMTEIDAGPEYKQVPAHISDTTGMFCTGGELWTKNGRCQMGCDHAEHYSNDGHPECEDAPDLPKLPIQYSGDLAPGIARARQSEPGWVEEAIAEQQEYVDQRAVELHSTVAHVRAGGLGVFTEDCPKCKADGEYISPAKRETT